MARHSETRRGVLTVAGGTLVALAGCSDSDGQSETPTSADGESDGMEPVDTETRTAEPTDSAESETGTPAEGDALLRVAHLAPAAPVDVAVDDNTVLTDVSFGRVSDYLSVTTGEHRITLASTGDHGTPATPTGESEAVFDETVTLERGPQTAAAVGEVSGQNQPFTVSLLTDDDTTASAGHTRVRAVHTIPDAPAVDVTAGDAVIADNVAFGEAGEYVAVPSDTGAVELRPESATDDAAPVGTFSVDLTDTAAQTVFAAGYLEPTGDQPGARLVVATDASGTAGGMGTGTPTGTETETGTAGTADGTGTPTDVL